jgi:hypothetical protein
MRVEASMAIFRESIDWVFSSVKPPHINNSYWFILPYLKSEAQLGLAFHPADLRNQSVK